MHLLIECSTYFFISIYTFATSIGMVLTYFPRGCILFAFFDCVMLVLWHLELVLFDFAARITRASLLSDLFSSAPFTHI